MSNIIAEYDDLFIYAPSYLLHERGMLTEGKAIGTANLADITMISSQVRGDLDTFAKERKIGQTVGKRILKKTQKNVYKVLVRLITSYQNERIDEKEFRERVVKMMKKAWSDVYLAGVRSSGVEAGKGKDLVFLKYKEDKWLKGAMKHEMQFLNKFIADVVVGGGKMPYPRRAKMYADAFSSFYDSARVIGMPNAVALYWTGKHDDRTCEGCKYLAKHSPFTKYNIPCTPRSGLTSCLTSCRDRLLIRKVPSKKVLELENKGLKKETHIRNLRKLKKGKKKA